MSEHDEQVALFDWARANRERHSQLRLLFSIPNGGLRNKVVAIKLKREGLMPGVPDIFLACPVMYWDPKAPRHGLFIEMKFGKNKPTPLQAAWHKSLKEEGYTVEVCYSFQEAKQAIIDYLMLEVE